MSPAPVAPAMVVASTPSSADQVGRPARRSVVPPTRRALPAGVDHTVLSCRVQRAHARSTPSTRRVGGSRRSRRRSFSGCTRWRCSWRCWLSARFPITSDAGPCLLAAIAVQIVAMVVFSDGARRHRAVRGARRAGSVHRVGVGCGRRGMLDIDRVRGTLTNAVAPILGTASGALLSGIFVQFLPVPTHLIYLTLLGVFALQAVGVFLMAETGQPQPGAWRSLRIQVGLPTAVRSAFLVAIPVLVALWSLGGFYASLGPALTRVVTGSTSPVLGGLALFVLAGSGAVAVVVTRNARPDRQMVLSTIGLVAGVALTIVAVDELSTSLYFVGTAIAGAGFGAAFQGAIRTVIPLARVHERSGVLSLLFVVSYLALGLPAVVGGYLGGPRRRVGGDRTDVRHCGHGARCTRAARQPEPQPGRAQEPASDPHRGRHIDVHLLGRDVRQFLVVVAAEQHACAEHERR